MGIRSFVENVRDRELALIFSDAISRLVKVEKESELTGKHITLTTFDSGRDDIENGMILHFRGSPDGLMQKALAGLLLLKSELDVEQQLSHVDVSTRRALQQSLLGLSQEDQELKQMIREGAERASPDSKQFLRASELIESALSEVGPYAVVRLFEEANDQSNPSKHIIDTLDTWVPKAQGISGQPLSEESRLRLLGRVDEITHSKEWDILVRSGGKTPYGLLTSIYSVLMKLVLQSEGMTIQEYTKLSNEVRVMHPNLGIKHVVPPSTISVEFSQLKKRGWVEIRKKHIYLSDKTRQMIAKK